MGRMCCLFFLFPILVIGWVPYFLCTIFLDLTDGKLTKWIRYPITFLVALIGIPMGVLTIPFAIIYWIYKLIRDCCFFKT